MLKTFGLGGLVLALLLPLLGCSGLASLGGGEPVTLHFVYFQDAADYEPLAQEFNRQNPNITIELDPVSFTGGDPMRTFQSKAAEADALRVSTFNMNEAIAAYFVPLDSFLTTDKDFPQDDLFAGSLDGMKLGGKLLGLPAGLNPYVMFYEPAKFEAAAVSTPTAGWNLEDFTMLALAMNNPDESQISTENYRFGFCSHPSAGDPVMFSYLFGGGIFDSLDQISAPTLNTRANIDALTWYASLRNEFGVMPPSESSRYMAELIARSHCGFWMDWLDGANIGRFMGDKNLSALPLPTYNASFSVAVMDAYAILSSSQHPEEAWKWLRFLMDQPFAAGSLVPPRRSHIDSQEFSARAAPQVVNVARGLPDQTVVLGLEMYTDPRLGRVLELYTEATLKVLEGDTDAQTALDFAQQEAEEAFGR